MDTGESLHVVFGKIFTQPFLHVLGARNAKFRQKSFSMSNPGGFCIQFFPLSSLVWFGLLHGEDRCCLPHFVTKTSSAPGVFECDI